MQCANVSKQQRGSEVMLRLLAPPLLRSGPVDGPLLGQIAAQLGIARTDIVDAEWADNGPGWIAILLGSAQAVLDVRPGGGDLVLGLAGPYPPGSALAFAVRAAF